MGRGGGGEGRGSGSHRRGGKVIRYCEGPGQSGGRSGCTGMMVLSFTVMPADNGAARVHVRRTGLQGWGTKSGVQYDQLAVLKDGFGLTRGGGRGEGRDWEIRQSGLALSGGQGIFMAPVPQAAPTRLGAVVV